MTLTEKNLTILKSLAQINEQMYFTSDELGVSTNAKDMLGYYSWGVTLEQEFGIFNVNELLSIISLYEAPSIIERAKKDETSSHLLIEEGNHKTVYTYTAKENIKTPPSRKVLFDGESKKIPDPIASFELTKQDLGKIKAQASVLKSPNIKLEKKTIIALDSSESSCNMYEHKINVDKDLPSLLFSTENFQKIYADDDYVVDVTNKFLILKSKAEKLVYIIVALAG